MKSLSKSSGHKRGGESSANLSKERGSQFIEEPPLIVTANLNEDLNLTEVVSPLLQTTTTVLLGGNAL
jgi:hypothetical protein